MVGASVNVLVDDVMDARLHHLWAGQLAGRAVRAGTTQCEGLFLLCALEVVCESETHFSLLFKYFH